MAATTDDILTVTEAAALAKCSPKTIYRAIQSGALVASAIGRGRTYRITRANFWRWMDAAVLQREPQAIVRLDAGTATAGSIAALHAIERDAA